MKTLWPQSAPAAAPVDPPSRAPAEAAALPWTFDRLYADRAQQVAAWAQRLGGPSIDVEDIVQEVFVVVHRRLSTLADPERLTTWLFRLTANKVRHQRRAARWQRLWHAERSVDHCSDPQALAPEALETKETEAHLYACLDKMKDTYRVPLILFELERLSGEAIAERLGVSLGTVWTRVHRGRKQLLAHLQRASAAERRRVRGRP